MTPNTAEGRWNSWAVPVSIALGVFAASMVSGKLLQSEVITVPVLWGSAGFTFAVLAMSPRVIWLRVLLALFLGLGAANAINGWSAVTVLMFGLANTIEAWVAAKVLRRAGDLRTMDIGRIVRFLIGALIGVAVGASVLSLLIPLEGRPLTMMRDYAMGHLTAMLVIGPAVLVLGSGHASWRPPAGRHVEGAIAAILALLTVWMLYGPWVDAPIAFFMILPMLWIASRLGLGFASLMTIVVCLAAAVGTVADGGPFRVIADPFLRVFTLQFHLISLSIMSLVLATVAARHQADLAALRGVAFVDQLTGLPNRRQLDILLGDSSSTSGVGGLFFADLDGFKNVNDTGGHSTGDRVLQLVAQRLAGAVDDGDHVVRLGGDEFAILVAEATSESDLAHYGARMVDALVQPFTVAGRQWTVGLSIGGVLLEPGATTDRLLARADRAMYRAKAAGGDQIIIGGTDAVAPVNGAPEPARVAVHLAHAGSRATG